MATVGIVGAGSMGAMLVRAHCRFDASGSFDLLVANRSEGPMEQLRAEIPGLRTAQPAEVVHASDLVFACLPPSACMDLAAGHAGKLRAEQAFVCIASSMDLDAVGQAVGDAAALKVVPSILHACGRGVVLITPGARTTDRHTQLVADFLKPFSRPWIIGDRDMRAATNVTSCGPAIVAHMARVLARSSESLAAGLDEADLEEMATETLAGLGALIDDGFTLSSTIDAVAKHGGTTEAAIAALGGDFEELMVRMHARTVRQQSALRQTRLLGGSDRTPNVRG